MTNELAIRILTGDVLGTTEQTHEAIKMAVKALSQLDVAGDCISRQMAIDTLRMDVDIIPFDKAKAYVRETIETIWNRLEQLPSTQTEIVRCKDCKYYMRPHGCGNDDGMATAQEDGHCSYAERKE